MSSVAMPRTATASARARRPGVTAVYRWELRKLLAQKRTFIGLGSALIVPLIFVIALVADTSDQGPTGLPFGDLVRETGFAVPLVSLAFGAFWLLPLITALVAGDIVATEDHNGTLKTILTRSVERWHVFAGKVLATLTYTAAVLAIYVGVALVAGGLIWGFDPLTTLSGTQITAGRALVLTLIGTLAYLLPMSAIAAIGIMLSTVTRNSAAAVVGTLMVSIFVQIIGSISALDALDPYLLSTQFNAWQGILREPTDWDPIIRSAWVCCSTAWSSRSSTPTGCAGRGSSSRPVTTSRRPSRASCWPSARGSTGGSRRAWRCRSRPATTSCSRLRRASGSRSTRSGCSCAASASCWA
jgi:ABC-2 type transport system permease protein